MDVTVVHRNHKQDSYNGRACWEIGKMIFLTASCSSFGSYGAPGCTAVILSFTLGGVSFHASQYTLLYPLLLFPLGHFTVKASSLLSKLQLTWDFVCWSSSNTVASKAPLISLWISETSIWSKKLFSFISSVSVERLKFPSSHIFFIKCISWNEMDLKRGSNLWRCFNPASSPDHILHTFSSLWPLCQGSFPTVFAKIFHPSWYAKTKLVPKIAVAVTVTDLFMLWWE